MCVGVLESGWAGAGHSSNELSPMGTEFRFNKRVHPNRVKINFGGHLWEDSISLLQSTMRFSFNNKVSISCKIRSTFSLFLVALVQVQFYKQKPHYYN